MLTPEERQAWEQEQKDKFGSTMKKDKGKVVRKPKAVQPLKLDPTEDEYADFKAQRLGLLKKIGKKLGLMVRGGEEKLDSDVFRFVNGKVEFGEGVVKKLVNANVSASGLVNGNRFLSVTQMPKEVFELVIVTGKQIGRAHV